MRTETSTELVLGLTLELPDALAGEVEVLPDLLERQFFSAQQSEAIPDDVKLPLVETAQRAADEGVHLLAVDLLLLALGLDIGEEGREAAFLVAIDVIVDREFALQQRQNHRELLGPSPLGIQQRACRARKTVPANAVSTPHRANLAENNVNCR